MPSRRVPWRGALVVLEGTDGAGKSTLQRALARHYRRAGYSVKLLREPHDPVLGGRAQEVGARDPWTSALLFTIDRLAARPRIETLLQKPVLVLQDRSFYSTLAYQGSALPRAAALRLETIQRNLALEPDRVLFLDLPARTAEARWKSRPGRPAPFERRATQARVARAYRRWTGNPGWIALDSGRPPGEVAASAVQALAPFLARRLGPGRRRK